MKRGIGALVCGALLAGCGSSNQTTSPSPTPTPTPAPAASPSRLDLTASPTLLLRSGSSVTITGRLSDASGAALANRSVQLSTSSGSLSASSATTDGNGAFVVTLTASATATVAASAGVNGSVDVPAVAPFAVTLDSKYSMIVPGDTVDMFVTVIPVQGFASVPSPSSVMLACGNGQTISLGEQRTGSCTYKEKDSYVATVTASTPNGFSTSASTRVIAEPKPITVKLTSREVSRDATNIEMELIVVGAPSGSVCSWEFGDGSTRVGACNQNYVYTLGEVDDRADVTVKVAVDPKTGANVEHVEVTFNLVF